MDRRIYRELNGPKMTEVQISQYLERIETDKNADADLEYLTKLQSANVNHIPYENLTYWQAGRYLLTESICLKK